MTWDSSKIDLSSLILRQAVQPHEEFRYRTKQCIYLETPRESLSVCENFLRTRRTYREFGPISYETLACWLWHAAHTCHVVEGVYGRIELRPAPSAGARHPIDLLIIDRHRYDVSVYDPPSHCLRRIQFNRLALDHLLAAGRRLLDYGDGMLIWLVGQPARTLAKYEHGEPFVLLDAGALIATLAFAAHALKLAFCPIGISGEPWLSQLIDSDSRTIGILGGVVGTQLD